MNVLFITNYDTMYGANISLFGMMIALRNMYDINPYLLMPGKGKMKELCDKAEIPCFCYEFRISVLEENICWKGVRRKTRRYMRYVDFYHIKSEIAKKHIHFEVVHSNSSIFDIGYFLARKWKVPHVWHVREFAKEDYGLDFVFSRKTLEKKFIFSDAVIAISDEIKNKIFFNNGKINVKRIYNGIDIVKEYNKTYFSGGITRFCIVGSIRPKKNQLDVVRACKKLEEQRNRNYRLFIVGDKEGDYYEQIQKFLLENPILMDRVIFTGYVEKTDRFLHDMDIGIMASDAEAFGRVTVEYMANYMPVLATKTGGTPEVVGDGGEYFVPHDIDRLSELMALYMENRQLVEERGRIARERVLRFTTERNAREIYEVYKEVIHAIG